ncbi:MAG: SUMF1/EgtB/PvdO family nonheme iron enzyme [Magnetococcales bacterium]|nr:SUMF1/EgtB/PvdO family nonheme iron enzyme [Magnetococcales bacterium]
MTDKFDLPLAIAERLIGCFTPKYKLVRSLGAGTYGQVFLVEDGLKRVAVKILCLEMRPEVNQEGEDQTRQSISRDWHLVNAKWNLLHHASLVRIRDYYRYEESDPDSKVAVYGLIYMDYWPVNLKSCIRRLIKRERYTPQRKRAILSNLAESLLRLKTDTGLLVTDLKPANILVNTCSKGPLTLAFADLGGFHREHVAEFRRVETTQSYLPPEILDKRQKVVDEKALVYSFGLIGLFVLEGRRPTLDPDFEGKWQDYVRQGDELPWSDEVRVEMAPCVAIIERCLAKDREARFSGFVAILEALKEEHQAWRQREQSRLKPRFQRRFAKPPSVSSVPKEIRKEPVTGMEFVWIPPGAFRMGQSRTEKSELISRLGEEKYRGAFSRELPRHQVELDGFWMGRYPVTWGQFAKFAQDALYMTDAEREGSAFGPVAGEEKWKLRDDLSWRKVDFKQSRQHPVVCVSWFDAKQFAAWLGQKSSMAFALPSEAQWEYACRAGTRRAYWFGDTIEADQAHFATQGVYGQGRGGEIGGETMPVGRYPANGFGLHDLHGNVWEWCEDYYDARFYRKPEAKEKNPLCRKGGGYRVRRGGSWSFSAAHLRASCRGRNYADSRYLDVGFRLVLNPET